MINESIMKENPFDQFNLWYNEELESKSYLPDAMTLSTVGADMMPSSRIVFMKILTEEGFIFFTNYRSKKGRQLEENPKASLLFFWPRLIRQVRVEGLVERCSEQISDDYFNSRPLPSRAASLLSKQSEPLDDKEAFDNNVKRLAENEEMVTRPEHWGGYVLKPQLFEFWQNREHRSHDRFAYTLEGPGWKITRLYP
ncbi:Pyridoxine/pyridoxamine 5'-phosphate oxidase [Bacteroidales bacterium CF]|nr:Pyridoxine/pyridoxamine 5'-phosphate oxidase [Bacteroidales bacterium CF]